MYICIYYPENKRIIKILVRLWSLMPVFDEIMLFPYLILCGLIGGEGFVKKIFCVLITLTIVLFGLSEAGNSNFNFVSSEDTEPLHLPHKN